MTNTVDTLTPKLARLRLDFPKMAQEAVTEASEMAADVIRINTPKSGITIRQRQQVNPERRMYYQSTLTGSVFKDKMTGITKHNPSQKIGYDDDDGWRAHFPDTGTYNIKTGRLQQPAQHFITKSQVQISLRTDKIFERKVKEVLS